MQPAKLPAIFASRHALEQAFSAGLQRQIDLPGLGTFILVLANASADASLWAALRPRVTARFDALLMQCQQTLRNGQPLTFPDDDLTVFLKLTLLSLDALETTHYRRAGPWEIQYNPLRALRPARASAQTLIDVQPPAFNAAGFHFNKPFLRPETLWEGELLHHPVRLLYNKFPFAPLHSLLVPDPERGLPQQLLQEWHLFAWHLAQAVAHTISGFTVTYNSYGAAASVNHLHFQTCVRDTPLPIEATHWQHHSGIDAYPTPCHTFNDALEAWFFIDHLHRTRQPYNLIYTTGLIYCLPRRAQGSYPQPTWSTSHAWYEMAGGATAFNRDDFDRITERDIHAALAQLSGAPSDAQRTIER